MTTLVALAIMAAAIWKSGILPKWSGWGVFVGFFLIPFPGVWLQFTTNLLWGAAYFWMAYAVFKDYGKTSSNPLVQETSLATV